MILFLNKHTKQIVGSEEGFRRSVMVIPGDLKEDDIEFHVIMDDNTIPPEVRESLLEYKFIEGEYKK